VRLPGGEYIEVHQPVSEVERWRIGVVDAPRALVLRPDERGRLPVLQRVRVRLSRFFFEDRIEVDASVGAHADAPDVADAVEADASVETSGELTAAGRHNESPIRS
jgi:ubiquinol-cytochrome c reductase cytochrome b subunit